VPVEVAALQLGPIEEVLKLAVSLEAEQEVKVYSRTANRVVELLVEEGDVVEKDQLLVRLEDELQTIAVAKAQNDKDKAQREFERQKPLYEQNLVSEQAFTDAQFELKRFSLALDDAKRELDYTRIRAPIPGTITRRLVNLGDYVTANQHLFDIVAFDSIVARVFHPEKHLRKLNLGQDARVRASALGDQEFSAYVKRISPIVEAKSGMVKVTLGFKELGTLRPGMHVETEIVLTTHTNALLIPKRALVYDGDQTYAYRLLPERKVERVLVEPEMSDTLHVLPASGFKAGDQIVVAGQTGLKDGALVRLPGDPEEKPENKEEEKSGNQEDRKARKEMTSKAPR
jgi:membrane fusion protein (multidrug efflux system)